jgi:hypothetical protein
MSIVEQTLGEDPADVYARMDFATQDRYRHGVEKMARQVRFYSLVSSTRAGSGHPSSSLSATELMTGLLKSDQIINHLFSSRSSGCLGATG